VQSAREPSYGQVERAQKEMNRAHLPDEASAELREDPVDLYQRAPEAVHCIGVA